MCDSFRENFFAKQIYLTAERPHYEKANNDLPRNVREVKQPENEFTLKHKKRKGI